MSGKKIDPTTISTVWHSMQTATKEMRYIIDRTCQNMLISQLHDVSCGLWGADGSTIAVPVGLPVQFLGGEFPIKDLIKKYPDDMAPGDVFLSNDPYHGGHANHLPDWAFFRPIFYNDELLFFTMTRAHQQDTGGSFPGGYFPNGHDIHAEGICIPPTRVVKAGVEQTEIFELIWNNVRFTEGVKIDNYSMIASTKVCEERVTDLLDTFGRDTVLACVEEMFDRTERAVRAEIAKIPDGEYTAEAATDDDGTTLDEHVWIRVKVTIDGDQMTIDFEDSDKQRTGFVNCVYAATYGCASGAAIMTFDPALSDYHNAGTMRAIDIKAPLGSVVNCEYPATVGASPVNMGNQIMEAVLDALSKARPDRSIAAWGKHRGDYTFGVDPRTNERYVRTSFDYDGSAGAVWGYDGYQGVTSLTAMGAINRGDMEEMEARLPWRILKYEMVEDFTGEGRWRGGPGIHWEAVNEGSDGQMATGSSDGDVVQGFGAQGGNPSPVCRTYIDRGDERIRVKPHRMVEVKEGDIIIKQSSGGGGVGDPTERDPAMVLEDVINELVSIKAAREIYKVDIDPKTQTINEDETSKLRAA